MLVHQQKSIQWGCEGAEVAAAVVEAGAAGAGAELRDSAGAVEGLGLGLCLGLGLGRGRGGGSCGRCWMGSVRMHF